jgi:importin subunit beta-1
MAAGTCLGLFAQCVPDNIVPPVLPFIEEHIHNADWHYREAAVMAFGSIVDGPQPHVISQLITQALPVLMGMMKDPVVHVKDTVAWTLGRVCEVQIGSVKIDVHLPNLVAALLDGLNDSPKIISNCSWVCHRCQITS